MPALEWGEFDPNDFYHQFRTYPQEMRKWIHDLKEGQSAFDNEDPEKRPHKVVDGKIVPNKQKKVAYINVNVGRVPQRPKSVIKINTGKRCMRCGEACWRSDVNYCWDCYKYEKFESR